MRITEDGKYEFHTGEAYAFSLQHPEIQFAYICNKTQCGVFMCHTQFCNHTTNYMNALYAGIPQLFEKLDETHFMEVVY